MPIRTTGDRITDRPLAEAGGKGLFTKEIDEALLAGRIDLAVHSAKDLPTRAARRHRHRRLPRARRRARRLHLAAGDSTRATCREGAVIGTSSLRRAALALRLRPDLQVVDLRGNVETRLRKLADGEADATLLALAGLTRLGLADRAAEHSRRRRRGCRRRGRGRSPSRRAPTTRAMLATACADRPSRRPRWRSPPSAPSSPCSTAPAARRSAGSRDRRRPAALPRHHRQAGRQRRARGRAGGPAPTRRKRSAPMPAARARPARRPGFLRRLSAMRLLVTRPEPDASAHGAAADGARPQRRCRAAAAGSCSRCRPGDLPQPAG